MRRRPRWRAGKTFSPRRSAHNLPLTRWPERTGRRAELHNAPRALRRSATRPKLAEQFAKGNISGEHVDALTSASSSLDDDQRHRLLDLDAELALMAASKTPEQFARHVRSTIQRLSDDNGVDRSEQQRDEARLVLGINDATGMGEIRGELHPDDFQKVNRRLDAEITALGKLDGYAGKTRAQLAAIALVNLVCSNRTTARVPAAGVIHIELDAINNIRGASRFGEYVDGTPVPAETVRRHACDASIIPVVLNGDGVPLDVGRAQRLAAPAQPTALRSMYRSCAVDGCETGFDRCEIHHIREWTQHRGPTDLRYLIPACSHHHHRFHEGRWRLELDPDTRELTIWYPDGTVHSKSRPDITSEHTPPETPLGTS